jgi:hypothetical protein
LGVNDTKAHNGISGACDVWNTSNMTMVQSRESYISSCISALAAENLELQSGANSIVTQTPADFATEIKAAPGWANTHDPNGADIAGADLNSAGGIELHLYIDQYYNCQVDHKVQIEMKKVETTLGAADCLDALSVLNLEPRAGTGALTITRNQVDVTQYLKAKTSWANAAQADTLMGADIDPADASAPMVEIVMDETEMYDTFDS